MWALLLGFATAGTAVSFYIDLHTHHSRKRVGFGAFLVWVTPGLAAMTVAWVFGLPGAGVFVALNWFGFCVWKGAMTLEEMQYAVVERLGKYHTTFFNGLHVRVIGIDRIRPVSVSDRKERKLVEVSVGDLRSMPIRLYALDRDNKIDFVSTAVAPEGIPSVGGISAPIDATLFVEVGEPGKTNPEEDVYRWAYGFTDPGKRLYSLVDSVLRPKLQSITIDEANTNRDDIADTVVESIAPAFREVGVYPRPERKSLVIEDIDLPEEWVTLRQKAVEGKLEAEQRQAQVAGYIEPIRLIMDTLGMSHKQAIDFYNTQQGLNVLRETKPNMTLVGDGLSGVLGTFNLGSKE